jgi:hypothetical protein
MMRGNTTNEISAAKRGGIFNSGEKSQNNGRKVFTAGNKSNGALPPTHPKGFGGTSTIQSEKLA